MNVRTNRITRLLAAAGLALALPLSAAHAMGPDDGCQGGKMHHHRHGPGAMGHEGGMGMPHFLRGLQLTEAQRDQIFRIHHEQAPALHEKRKEIRQAHAALHEMVMSGQYDEARARAQADAASRAMAELALMHARSGNQIYQLLTPEQRKKAAELRAEGPGSRAMPHRPEGPGRDAGRSGGARRGE